MKLRISAVECYAYLLFAVLFKAYFIPEIVRQAIKVTVLLALFFLILNRLNKKEIFNLSLLLVTGIILSAVLNFFTGGYPIKSLLDSMLLALSLYDLYTFFLYCFKYHYLERVIRCFYRVNVIYCMLTLFSVAIVGTENNSNVPAYLFGNKFTSSYLFISLCALYGATHNMQRRKNQVNLMLLLAFVILFSLYIGCATVTVTVTVVTIIYIVNHRCKKIFCKPSVVTITLVLTALVPFAINAIISIDFVSYIIFDLFNKGPTVLGRFRIYLIYLPALLAENFLFGHGYSSEIMLEITNGVFANAQNGLLEYFMNFGVLGAAIVVIMTFYCVKKGNPTEAKTSLFILLYSMIVAAIFEVTINYFFWIALFLIRWSSTDIVTAKNI